jgi:hypothetical protein
VLSKKFKKIVRWAVHAALVGDRMGAYTVLWGDLSERNQLEDLGIDRRIIKWIFWKWDGGMDWIHLAQNRDGWRYLLNTVMSLLVS